jgi:hypothetical protein
VYAVILMAPAGTYAENIYIHSEAELRQYLAQYDSATVTFHLERNISVIGSPAGVLNSGTLDGHGHTVNLTITDSSSTGQAGLLGGNGGVVKNLRLTGTVSVSTNSGDIYAGAVAGLNIATGTIRNVSSTVIVTAANTSTGSAFVYAGGIVGENYGLIDDCSAGETITGNRNAGLGTPNTGGIAGKNSGAINRCYAWGNVISDNNSGPTGGIAGFNEGEVSNCAALNSKVDNVGTYTTNRGRVIGNNSSGSMNFNYAYDLMQLGSSSTGISGSISSKDGENIPTTDLASSGSDTWWTVTGVGWPTFQPGSSFSEPSGSPWYWSKTVAIPMNSISGSGVSAYVPALWFE